MKQSVERLEKTLARVAKEQGLAQERLRRWVSFLALCGVMERAVNEGRQAVLMRGDGNGSKRGRKAHCYVRLCTLRSRWTRPIC